MHGVVQPGDQESLAQIMELALNEEAAAEQRSGQRASQAEGTASTKMLRQEPVRAAQAAKDQETARKETEGARAEDVGSAGLRRSLRGGWEALGVAARTLVRRPIQVTGPALYLRSGTPVASSYMCR